MVGFSYECPQDWAVASQMLAEQGSEAKMGGCDILTRFRQGSLDARCLIGLHRLPDIANISRANGELALGAGVTIEALARLPELDKHWPVFATFFRALASPAIRRMATVVGNIAQRWSASDFVPFFQVTGSYLIIRSIGGERKVSVQDFYRAERRNALKPGEIIAQVVIPLPKQVTRTAYQRFAQKNAFDMPMVSVAVSLPTSAEANGEIAISCVGAAKLPDRNEAAEAALRGRTLNEAAIKGAVEALKASVSPAEDFRASSAYRSHLLGALLQRALTSIASQR